MELESKALYLVGAQLTSASAENPGWVTVTCPVATGEPATAGIVIWRWKPVPSYSTSLAPGVESMLVAVTPTPVPEPLAGDMLALKMGVAAVPPFARVIVQDCSAGTKATVLQISNGIGGAGLGPGASPLLIPPEVVGGGWLAGELGGA
jgi:hypothetical protein